MLVRRSRALFEEWRAREDGESHREVEGREHSVQEGLEGRVDGGGGWREKHDACEDEFEQTVTKT